MASVTLSAATQATPSLGDSEATVDRSSHRDSVRPVNLNADLNIADIADSESAAAMFKFRHYPLVLPPRLCGAAAGNRSHLYIGKICLFITRQTWLYQAAPPGAAQKLLKLLRIAGRAAGGPSQRSLGGPSGLSQCRYSGSRRQFYSVGGRVVA